MTAKTFAAERLRLGLVSWSAETTIPNTAAIPGGIGSMHLRTGTSEIYYNQAGSTDGWTRQNLFNVNVYNVRDYGALGDGSTDAGAKKLDEMRARLRSHKGKKLARGKFSDNAKDPMEYVK